MTMCERIYRVLLKTYPRAFLREYGGPMEQLFKDQLKDAIVRKQVIQFWGRILADVLKTAPAYHWLQASTARGGTMRWRQAGAMTFAAVSTCLGIRLAFYGDYNWFSGFYLRHLPVAASLTCQIAVFTALSAVIVAAAFGLFLLVVKNFNRTSLLRGLLAALPIFAIGRIGWILMWLWTPEPPYRPAFVVRNLCLQWLPVFLGLALSMWTAIGGGRLERRSPPSHYLRT
jgi:hypothetical protein